MQKQLVEKERILAQIPLGFQFLDATTKIRENFCNNRTLQMLVKSFFRQNSNENKFFLRQLHELFRQIGDSFVVKSTQIS